MKNLCVGLDIGSEWAKIVVRLPWNDAEVEPVQKHHFSDSQFINNHWLLGKRQRVMGDPIKAAEYLLSNVWQSFGDDFTLKLQLTGSHAKLIAELLNVPYVNEFKAIGRGAAELLAEVRTILEIGGDVSRYMHISFDAHSDELAILDYERNGDCAAGTGSFIDQQAARLKYRIEEIGSLVLTAQKSANIAGRCSVFAKSDMVHAQQRGYSPAAIFKGLCEAVVRNYKGTVLRGKTLVPPVVFIGGMAANQGVVEAMTGVLKLDRSQLKVPDLHFYVGALGCAILAGGAVIKHDHIIGLRQNQQKQDIHISASKKLDNGLVQYSRINSDRNESFVSSDAGVEAFLGIDVGSVSTNFVLLDRFGRVIDEIYTRTEGRPVEVVNRELSGWHEKWAFRLKICGVGTTGSGREIIGELVGADVICDEITAHKTGANFVAKLLFNEQVDTIFEIGGQDSKFISIEDGIVVDFTMNEACAAGTGSFLEEQASKLGISIVNEFEKLAFSSENPVTMGERCTVFMEKDVSAFLQQGIAKKDIAAGLAFAVVQNYLNRVVRGRRIGNHIYFQGGTAYNRAVAAAFATTLKKRVVVPPHNGVIGAIGTALLAKERYEKTKFATRFYGFNLQKVDYEIRHFTCKGCSNNCDIQECTVCNEKTYWGDKCSQRYRKKPKVNLHAVIPDLFAMYQDQILRDVAGPDGLGLKIGVPRTMYFYDRFPFWRTYLSAIGAEIILSDTTNRKIVTKGREYCIAEPCFPIIVSHGHVVDLFQKNVDFVLLANVINSETENWNTESWFCPWAQTLPLVLKNTLFETDWSKRILAPTIRFRDGKNHVQKALYDMVKPFGISRKRSDRAVELAYYIQKLFRETIKKAGLDALQTVDKYDAQAVILVGRPYNMYDPGMNLSIPNKLKEQYGINVIPMDFLPSENLDISDIHENMFWNYGRRILQTAKYVGQNPNLHIIYITNFKCGPDSYIKHFVRNAAGAPYLTLQFDDHSNDAGILTRCEAYLESKGLLKISEPIFSISDYER